MSLLARNSFPEISNPRIQHEPKNRQLQVLENLAALRLLERLPEQPMISALKTAQMLQCAKPTAIKAIESLEQANVLVEITGKLRDRIYAYRKYLDVLGQDTLPIA